MAAAACSASSAPCYAWACTAELLPLISLEAFIITCSNLVQSGGVDPQRLAKDAGRDSRPQPGRHETLPEGVLRI